MPVILAVLACVPPDEVSPTPSPAPPSPTVQTDTWADVPELLEAHCAGCHTEGGVAPFPITSWDDANAFAAPMANAIETGTMPPWPADPADVTYRDDRTLPDDAQTRILDWVDAGAPAWGSPPRDLVPVPNATLDRVDVVATMTEGYAPQLSPDDIRCFLLDIDPPLEGWVLQSRVVPGNRAVVHHSNFVTVPVEALPGFQALDDADDGPGWDCNTFTPGVQGTLATYLPGQNPLVMPPGSGVWITPDSAYVLVTHYWEPGYDGIPDVTQVELMVSDTVERPAEYLTLSDNAWSNGVLIPPGETEALNVQSWRIERLIPKFQVVDASAGLELHSVLLHMHEHGASGALHRVQGADSQVLLEIGEWDFGWQLDYPLTEPVVMEPGDLLTVACEHTSDGKELLRWGDGSGDEMCNAKYLFTGH